MKTISDFKQKCMIRLGLNFAHETNQWLIKDVKTLINDKIDHCIMIAEKPAIQKKGLEHIARLWDAQGKILGAEMRKLKQEY